MVLQRITTKGQTDAQEYPMSSPGVPIAKKLVQEAYDRRFFVLPNPDIVIGIERVKSGDGAKGGTIL